MEYVSRAGQKLQHALDTFGVNIRGFVCADFGSNKGGFVDCLLQNGAIKVYAVETGYGTLEWKLRKDERVVVMERTNAMHVELPEKMDMITVDTSWTKLDKVIPNALQNLKDGGRIIALVKPHYEAEPKLLRKGTLPDEFIPAVLSAVQVRLEKTGVQVVDKIQSPIVGGKGKNKEYLLYLKRA